MSYQKQAYIRRTVKRLTAESAAIDNKLLALRERCPHPSATKVPKANTGNYDPHDNCYWYEFECPDCGKFWTEDQ